MEFVKEIYALKAKELINDWFKTSHTREDIVGYIRHLPSDFQNQKGIYFDFKKPTRAIKLTKSNIINAIIYAAVRLCIPATWINDRDQFTKPFVKRLENAEEKCNESQNFELSGEVDVKTPKNDQYLYEDDENFIGNCIVFALFEKNFTDWQIFPNSEMGLSGVSRDMTVHNLLIKGRDFGNEAKEFLEVARKIYTLYYANFNDYTAGWDEVRKTLKDDKISDFDVLWKEFKSAKQALADLLVDDVYKYGFLRG